jgi:hypothetical protein
VRSSRSPDPRPPTHFDEDPRDTTRAPTSAWRCAAGEVARVLPLVRTALDRRLIRLPTRCCRIRRPSTRPAHDCWGAVVETLHDGVRPVTLPSHRPSRDDPRLEVDGCVPRISRQYSWDSTLLSCARRKRRTSPDVDPKTMAFGHRTLSSRRAAGGSQRFAASSVLNMNDTRLICELHLNSRSRATAPGVLSTSHGVGRATCASRGADARPMRCSTLVWCTAFGSLGPPAGEFGVFDVVGSIHWAHALAPSSHRPPVRDGFPGIGRASVNGAQTTDEGEVNGAESASTTRYCRRLW